MVVILSSMAEVPVAGEDHGHLAVVGGLVNAGLKPVRLQRRNKTGTPRQAHPSEQHEPAHSERSVNCCPRDGTSRVAIPSNSLI